MITNGSPSRDAFWRFILGSITVLSLLAAMDLLERAHQLGVDVAASLSWQALFSFLFLVSILCLLGLALSFSAWWKRLWGTMEAPGRLKRFDREVGALLSIVALIGPSILLSIPYIRFITGGEYWLRFFIFWPFSLVGTVGVKMIRRETPLLVALLAMAFFQTALNLVLGYLSSVSAYPFATGWSEASRHYSPSLFLSEKVYGQKYAWPFQNHTLHLILAIPYLFGAPLWFHRFWEVALSLTLVGMIVPVLISRLSLKESSSRWLIGLWMFLFLLIGPIYYHLAIPVIVLLLGFSSEKDLRTWVAVIAASLWAGWSRINWFPVPGLIAAVLYLLEVPFYGKNLSSYLRKPALWFLVGTLVAFLSQRIYIAISGIPESNSFYTSFTSSLLWYRLLPNATYALGILPATILVSLPLCSAIFSVFRKSTARLHPVRVASLVAALLVLFVGGLVVSVKIGGGADLHNLDAFFILLLLISSYLVFARYRNEKGAYPRSRPLHWAIVLVIAMTPVWMLLPNGIGYQSYDVSRTNGVLAELQRQVDRVNRNGGEMLFITQRHLISMHLLNDVTLVPEYEREELMEMAMGNNRKYLSEFRRDMEMQRFDVIVVDPLTYSLLGPAYQFGEENNAWVQKIMKHILCNYREEIVFTEDRIAIYVPQLGERQCPVIGSNSSIEDRPNS